MNLIARKTLHLAFSSVEYYIVTVIELYVELSETTSETFLNEMERYVWGMKCYHRVGSLRGLVEAQLSRTVPIWNISFPATLPTLPSYRNIQKISQHGYQRTFRLGNKTTTVMRTKSFHGMCFLNTASQATLQALRPIERCYHQKSNLPGVAGDVDPHIHILYSHITMSIYLIIYHSRCPSKSPSTYLDSRFCIHLLYPSIFTYLELRPRHRQTERTDDRACAYRLPRNHRLCIHQHWYLGGNSPIAAANTVSQPKHATTTTTFQSFHIYNLNPPPKNREK